MRALTTRQSATAGYSGGAQSSAVRSKRMAAVGMMTSPILDSRIRLPQEPTRMKIRAPLWTASGSTMPMEGPPIPEVVTETSISRYFPVCETRPRVSFEKRRASFRYFSAIMSARPGAPTIRHSAARSFGTGVGVIVHAAGGFGAVRACHDCHKNSKSYNGGRIADQLSQWEPALRTFSPAPTSAPTRYPRLPAATSASATPPARSPIPGR